MNVIDSLKNLSVPDIKQYCQLNTIDAIVAMSNVEGDFNFSTIVRNANFFGFKKVIHISSKKKWDRRGSVGTYHYTPIEHYLSEQEFIDRHKDRTIVAVENNIPRYADKTVNLFDKKNLYYNPLFLFGSENHGLSDYLLDSSDEILTINNYGSVRSINVGTASGIVMSYYRNLVTIHSVQ